MSGTQLLPLEAITQRIVVLREQKVLIDADLAALYGVETRRLNEQVRRNRERFPEDFIFELSAEEFANLKSQTATSSWGGRRKLPFAFTEHGAIMAATVLNTPRAVEVSVYVVRAFVKLRELVASHRELARRLEDLEQATESLAMSHDTLNRNTRAQFKQVFDALRALMAPPEPAKRPIGFVHPEDKSRK
ncbi:MAG: ORF6N domain-containing protein [Burkholderiaceae bacterium]